MVIFEKRRVAKSTRLDNTVCQGVTDVRGSKAVTYANKLCVCITVQLLHGVVPLWHGHVCKGRVLCQPALVVKVEGLVVPVLAMLPNGVLVGSADVPLASITEKGNG